MMLGFEPWISGIGDDSTTTGLKVKLYILNWRIFKEEVLGLRQLYMDRAQILLVFERRYGAALELGKVSGPIKLIVQKCNNRG